MIYWFPSTLQRQISSKENESWTTRQHKWNENNKQKIFKMIENAKTGIPIIDASLRCLYVTGFMHNRLRMILCMYLVRHLQQDWRIYERWFATKVVDYYPSANRGGWEWAILYRYKLSPWMQTKRFDPECKFILKWVPELAKIPIKDILNWDKKHENYKNDYPSPYV